MERTRGAERIAKALARAGVASRRQVERMIAAGRVALDGVPLTTPVVLIDDVARVTVDGKPVRGAQETRLWRYHKPVGLVTTHNDPQRRRTVFDNLPRDLPRVISVGRLDQNTEGLLLLTNDGALARHLELPATGWRRRYRVRVTGGVDTTALASLASGLTLDGVVYGAIEARREERAGHGVWLSIVISEGKNREVRNVLRHLGLSILQLVRVAFGPFLLGGLAPGAVDEVASAEVAAIKVKA